MKTETEEKFEKALAPFNPVKGELRKYRIETIVGPLDLEIVQGKETSHELFIACVFMDVEKAKTHSETLSLYRFNKFSGKWNWHIFEFGDFKRKISKTQFNAIIKNMFDTFFAKLESIKAR